MNEDIIKNDSFRAEVNYRKQRLQRGLPPLSPAEANIRAALLECLKTQPIEKLKVTDLIKTANISRSSFYNYYCSVFDVLDQIEDDFFLCMNRKSSNIPDAGKYENYIDTPNPTIVAGLEILKDFKDTVLVLWGDFGDKRFQYKFTKRMANAESLKLKARQSDSQASDISFSFLFEGWKGAILRWLESYSETFSSEEMAMLLCKLIS